MCHVVPLADYDDTCDQHILFYCGWARSVWARTNTAHLFPFDIVGVVHEYYLSLISECQNDSGLKRFKCFVSVFWQYVTVWYMDGLERTPKVTCQHNSLFVINKPISSKSTHENTHLWISPAVKLTTPF